MLKNDAACRIRQPSIAGPEMATAGLAAQEHPDAWTKDSVELQTPHDIVRARHPPLHGVRRRALTPRSVRTTQRQR